MKMKIAATALALVPMMAAADPALVVTPRIQGGELKVSTEFLADPAKPVAALIYEINMDPRAKGYSKAGVKTGSCVAGLPAGFTGICNPGTDKGAVRVVIYSTSPNAALPSGTIGEISLPASAVKLARDGEIELGFVEFTTPDAKVISGETLVDVEPALRVNNRIERSGDDRRPKTNEN